MTSQPQARHVTKADPQVHASGEHKHVEQKKTWLQRLKSLQGSKASRAAMLDQLHAFSISARTPASSTPMPPPGLAVTGRSESAFPLYSSSRPSTAHSHFPARPVAPSSGSQSARPAASFRSVSRLRGGVDPAAPAAMAAPLAKSRGEAAVVPVDDSCDSVGRRLAHRRSASRHPNPQAAPAPSPAAPPAAASGATRYPSNPHARHPSGAAAHRVSPAAHRMSPSARTSAFARSITAAATAPAHLSPAASRRAARQ